MKSMRHILGDRLTAGILTALVAYVMLLQGLVSAYAQGALTGSQPGSTFVICSLTGAVPGTEDYVDEPLERAAHQCCAALCHAAASFAPILPPADPGPAFIAEAGPRLYFPTRHAPPRPSILGLLPEARAPPPISI